MQIGLVFSDDHSSDSDGDASCPKHRIEPRPNFDQTNVSAQSVSSTSANVDPLDTLEFLRNQAGSSTSNEGKNFDSLLSDLSRFYALANETSPDIVMIVDAFDSIINTGIQHYPNDQALEQTMTKCKRPQKLLKFEHTQS